MGEYKRFTCNTLHMCKSCASLRYLAGHRHYCKEFHCPSNDNKIDADDWSINQHKPNWHILWPWWWSQVSNLHKEKVTYSTNKLPCIDSGLTYMTNAQELRFHNLRTDLTLLFNLSSHSYSICIFSFVYLLNSMESVSSDSINSRDTR
jgi:hypothetical protein